MLKLTDIKIVRPQPKFSTVAIAIIFYLLYAIPSKQFFSVTLIMICTWQIFYLYPYARFLRKIESNIKNFTSLNTISFVSRFFFHTIINSIIFTFIFYNIVDPGSSYLQSILSGIAFSCILSIYSIGFQYTAISLAKINIGEPDENVTVSLLVMMTAAAAAAFNFDHISWYISVTGALTGAIFFIKAAKSDLESKSKTD